MSCDTVEFNEFETTARPRARKEHECCACDWKIRRGDIYERTFTVFDGSPGVFVHCLRCAEMFKLIARKHRALRTGEGVQYDLNCGHSWRDVFSEPAKETA